MTLVFLKSYHFFDNRLNFDPISNGCGNIFLKRGILLGCYGDV
jgi:hypothetical protein